MPRKPAEIETLDRDVVLGLDLSTWTGFAVLDSEGERLTSGTLDLRGSRFEGGGARYLRFEVELRSILDRWKPKLVSYEVVRRIRGNDAQAVYHGLWATLTRVLEEVSVPYVGVEISAAKNAATGKGNASKEDVAAAANARWGLSLVVKKSSSSTDDNESDALWVAEVARLDLRKALH